MLRTYIIVGAGFVIGAYFGIFVIEYDPPIMAWFFSTGTGLALGAFVASAVWQLLLAGSGSLLGRLLRGRRGQLGISLGSALIMLALSGGLLLS